MQHVRVALPMSSAATRSTSSTASSVSSTWSPRVSGTGRPPGRPIGQTESRTRVLAATMQGPSHGFQRQTVSRAQRPQGQATSAGGHPDFQPGTGVPPGTSATVSLVPCCRLVPPTALLGIAGGPVALIGGPLALVGTVVAFISGPLALVGEMVALVGGPLPLVEVVPGPVQRG